MDEERRRYPPDLRVRVSLLEQWQAQHNDWAHDQAKRVDTLWDWRAEVRPVLKTTNRLLWAVLTALLADIGLSGYLIVFGHVH